MAFLDSIRLWVSDRSGSQEQQQVMTTGSIPDGR